MISMYKVMCYKDLKLKRSHGQSDCEVNAAMLDLSMRADRRRWFRVAS